MSDPARTVRSSGAANHSRPASWQAERRAETRRRLLDAAAQAFARSGYVGTRVEDILTIAGVGRTSFYKQFRDRLDIAAQLFTQFMPRIEGTYLAIRACDTPDHETVALWIDRLVDAYAGEAGVMRVFAEITAIEPDFSGTISQVQAGIMRGLGERFPPFACAAAARSGDLHTRASLVLETIDHVCAMIALRQAALSRTAAVGFAADAFIAFVTESSSFEAR